MALFNAASQNDYTRVKELLVRGCSTEKSNKKGVTPLGIAAARGFLEVVKLLLVHGACVNAVMPQNGYTPLYFAAENGHYDVEDLLLNNGGACVWSRPSFSKAPWYTMPPWLRLVD